MRSLLFFILLQAFLNADEIVIITHTNVAKLNKENITKVYTGKLIKINNVPIIPIHRKENSIENDFLQQYLNMDRDKYIAYWTVRQYIGKGTAPKALRSSKEVLNFVKNTKGAVAYITKKELRDNPIEGVLTFAY